MFGGLLSIRNFAWRPPIFILGLDLGRYRRVQTEFTMVDELAISSSEQYALMATCWPLLASFTLIPLARPSLAKVPAFQLTWNNYYWIRNHFLSIAVRTFLFLKTLDPVIMIISNCHRFITFIFYYLFITMV